MNITASSNFKRRLRKLSQGNTILAKRIDKKLSYLAIDMNHPSLKLHKVQTKNQEAWSISVTGDIRIIFKYIDDGIQLVDIGSHNEVYRPS